MWEGFRYVLGEVHSIQPRYIAAFILLLRVKGYVFEVAYAYYFMNLSVQARGMRFYYTTSEEICRVVVIKLWVEELEVLSHVRLVGLTREVCPMLSQSLSQGSGCIPKINSLNPLLLTLHTLVPVNYGSHIACRLAIIRSP